MSGKMITHHYTECGLPNVWIRCRQVIDDAGQKVYIISRIGILHKAIAHEVVNSRGALTGREIKFLRSILGLTPAEFGKLIHRQPSTVSRWERGAAAPGSAVDFLIRLLAILKLKLDADPDEISARCKKVARKPRIRITKKEMNAVSMAA